MQNYIRCHATISNTTNPGSFHITWINIETNTREAFDVSAGDIDEKELLDWRSPQYHLSLGQKLFRFLDGNSHFLSNTLNNASISNQTPIIYLHTSTETENWPFELIARDNGFLLPGGVHLIRCFNSRGLTSSPLKSNEPLKLLFMACSAQGVEPVLNFEKEEEAIYNVTEKLPIDIEVEDSGSLDGLMGKLSQEKYDVLHLSGHAGICDAGIAENGESFFIMEDELGQPQAVTARELYEKALIDNMPKLVFVSGCHTGEKKDGNHAVSFCRELVEKYNVPAALGWGRDVDDEEASFAASVIYRELSRGRSIADAVQRARYELMSHSRFGEWSDWVLLRLFGDMEKPDGLVMEHLKKQPKQRFLRYTFLQNSLVKVLEQGFVGRRRPIQKCLAALKSDKTKEGVVILGAGGLGKSCLAGKLCERLKGFHLIVVHGKFNAITFEEALRKGFMLSGDEEGMAILDKQAELTERVKALCVRSFKKENYLFLLDDFEQNLEEEGIQGPPATDSQPGRNIESDARALLSVLLEWLPNAGKMTQLIITSRYMFGLVDRGRELVSLRLALEYLNRFGVSELDKKVIELVNISRYPDEDVKIDLINAGHGNPRLMEWLDKLVSEMGESEVAQLMERVKGKQEEFICEHVLRELVIREGEDFGKLIRWLSIYRCHVSLDGVKVMGEALGLNEWKPLLEKGVWSSLVEYYEEAGLVMVTGVMRDELMEGISDCESCHRAGLEYYLKENMAMKASKIYDPVLIEELIYHALGCGEEDMASGEGGGLVKYLIERLAFREAERVGEWILNQKKSALSTGNDAMLVNNLGFLYDELGDRQKAIGYYEQAMAIDEKVYGKEHPDVAIDLNNLGSAYDALGEKENAIGYYEQALAIDEKVYGKEHPKVAIRLNNLGLAYKGLGEIEKAIGYYEQAMAIWKNVYGDEHPQVAIGLNNLGVVYDDLGEKEKAIGYFEQALAIDEKVYGKEHPSVARELNNLGMVYKGLGDLEKAIGYYEQAMAIDENVYGKEHPDVAIDLNNLGSAYFTLEKKDLARQYLERAYAIFLKFYGPEHPSSITTKEWLELIN